jgi:DNA-binding NarL/FixJ family response regulator
MDINLGGINGIEVVRQLKQRVPQMQFMMCTVYEDDDKIFDALRAGASGYILKKTPPLQLVDAIGELHQGGSPMTPLIARKVVAAFINTTPLVDSSYPQREDEDLNRLSKREREILEMMASGKPHKDIADELGISPQTVRKHVFNIYEKLHVSNRVEAINKYFGRQ